MSFLKKKKKLRFRENSIALCPLWKILQEKTNMFQRVFVIDKWQKEI